MYECTPRECREVAGIQGGERQLVTGSRKLSTELLIELDLQSILSCLNVFFKNLFQQDFGPKVNFKKKKLKSGSFSGLPKFSQFIVERLQKGVSQLEKFHPVELCNLDYCPERGASIDPHIDDTWLWGEHLVTINLLADTILTLTNLENTYEIRIPMPRCSLVILKGSARITWMHGIKREDIKSRRIAVTLRELSEEFLSGEGHTNIGRTLLELASSFNGLPTST